MSGPQSGEDRGLVSGDGKTPAVPINSVLSIRNSALNPTDRLRSRPISRCDPV